MSEMVEKALSCLGKGFDVNSDFRLKYCKGYERLIVLNDKKASLAVPGFGSFREISIDIKCDKGDRIRYRSDVLDFVQMSELVNQKSSIAGKIPSGLLNSMFGFSDGLWAEHAVRTRCLAYDGYFISFFNLGLQHSPLSLSDDVIRAVPTDWNPAALSRFIEKYGTHIVSGLSVGGQDVVFVRQDHTSNLTTSELKGHLSNLGDQLFTGTCTLNGKNREKVPEAFNVFNKQPMIGDGLTSISTKKGITVICSKRGGYRTAHGHSDWLHSVPSAPDAINFSFIPITSLLKNVPGKGFLSHAINLYLRYKPPISDLEYFLDFQNHKVWAPMLNDHPLGPSSNRPAPTSWLQFKMMGPKLYVNTNQVTTTAEPGPVTGMRMHLEGKRNNRLAIHLQHLSNTPSFIAQKMDGLVVQREADEAMDEAFYSPVQNKMLSHVCTAAVKYNPMWENTYDGDAVFIVAGAQLVVKKHDSKNVLHLKLCYTKVSDYIVKRSVWEQGMPSSTESGRSSGFFSTMITSVPAMDLTKPGIVMDSSVFPTGPPVPVHKQKLLTFVDTSQICKGPKDSPGHWLATGAKLESKKGKICLSVKFSLLWRATTAL